MPLELGLVAAGLNNMAAKLAASYEELEKYSYHDHLTGCLNKRKLDEDISRELSRANRYGEVFSLLLLDLDHFKQVNDRYGHQAGDEVLKQVVSRVASQLRTADSLYRYGGEEFIIILPHTERGGALTVAERIRRNIGNTDIRLSCDQFVAVTVSIGIAVCPEDAEEDADQLIEIADKCVYRAKEQGRNRVVHT
jgi:diguanylate cyclase (GGDEF)-like protein